MLLQPSRIQYMKEVKLTLLFDNTDKVFLNLSKNLLIDIIKLWRELRLVLNSVQGYQKN